MSDTLKQAYRRGFTLIELMIVIVILGILMGTLLPRLTGAQGRARDTARLADLHSIQLALELFYNDYGRYPNASQTDGCLLPTHEIKSYLKNLAVPAPQGNKTVFTCVTAGYYYYMPLTNGTENQSYILAAGLENFTTENTIAAADATATCISASTGTSATTNCIKLAAAPSVTAAFESNTDIAAVAWTNTVGMTTNKITADSTTGQNNTAYAIINR